MTGPSAQPVPSGRLGRAAYRMPSWTGSLKVRLAFLYSAVVFGLFALVIAGIYIGLSRSLARQPITAREFKLVPDRACVQIGSEVLCSPTGPVTEIQVVDAVQYIEKSANARALDQFKRYSFVALGGMFLVSLGVGWALAHRALMPIGRITKVARRIQATDLSQRIELRGPDDELKELADTFDGMLGRLEDAWENQRAFIHEASHELRNPIAVIRTNVDVALSDGDSNAGELRESLSVVGRAAERMGVLVDDLLTYARREAPALRTTSVDLGEVVARTTAQFEAPAAARGLRLAVESGRGLHAQGDPVALEQALANLLANATRLAPQDSTVTVSAGRDGPWVWMAVTDEGPGLAAEQQAKVFERFWKGDPARSRAEGRSGLGLTIVRQIARGHGGSVALQSTPGEGSTFSVWLPAQEAPRPDEGEAPDAELEGEERETPSAGGGRAGEELVPSPADRAIGSGR
ncbi:MAG: HAMP domain-containing protein [Acidimicrobiia bacterium]|nr:HAMP domain-containing protein [Acidimicrobiia bacterium]